MPDYLPPTVVGPLSPCSRTVTVQGIVPGQLVSVLKNGDAVVTAMGTWPTQQIPLPGGVTFGQGDVITAQQGDSDPTPALQAVQVLNRPGANVGPVALVSHLYVGAQCLWVDGAIPGATVKVFASGPASGGQGAAGRSVGGIVQGSGLTIGRALIGYAEAACGGAARVKLTQAVGPNDTVFLQQSASGVDGPLTQQPAPNPFSEPGAFKDSLPAPVFDGDLHEGQKAVRVEGILEGATVTITVAGTTGVESDLVDRTAIWMPLPASQSAPTGSGVQVGSRYSVSQAFPDAVGSSKAGGGALVGSSSGTSQAQGVGGTTPAPTILRPVCAGDPFILLTDLIFGAEVTVTVYRQGIYQGTRRSCGTPPCAWSVLGATPRPSRWSRGPIPTSDRHAAFSNGWPSRQRRCP